MEAKGPLYIGIAYAVEPLLEEKKKKKILIPLPIDRESKPEKENLN